MSLCRVFQNSCRFNAINCCSFRRNLFSATAQRFPPVLKILKVNETANFTMKEFVQPMTKKYIYNSSIVLSKKADIKAVTKNVKKELDVKENKDESKSKEHSLLWVVERIVNVIILIGIPAAFSCPCPELDIAIATATVMHSHWAMDNILIDYIPLSSSGVLMTSSKALLFTISILTLAGLLFFNFNDIGIAEAIKKFWKLQPPKEEPIENPKKKS